MTRAMQSDRLGSGILLGAGLAMIQQSPLLAHAGHYKDKEAEPDNSNSPENSEHSERPEPIEQHDPEQMEQAESAPDQDHTNPEVIEPSPQEQQNQVDQDNAPNAVVSESEQPVQANVSPLLGLGEGVFLLVAIAPILLFTLKRKLRH
ncbi:hypothetical protein Pse7367_0951 [Thalassoporum mexicanum PCC 7367]|uniref:hypothetical protein n=1 Tax=Thalassoporum mexicanum TaxID=3457544 RepID=UPI0002A00040|nr:hypothetical protein [Pseudanabaena sp. PCC 7367]AFY69251.1 hypothetical protein Pse7367_0951 [Pseudanabaena sp. PCC 7367]